MCTDDLNKTNRIGDLPENHIRLMQRLHCLLVKEQSVYQTHPVYHPSRFAQMRECFRSLAQAGRIRWKEAKGKGEEGDQTTAVSKEGRHLCAKWRKWRNCASDSLSSVN